MLHGSRSVSDLLYSCIPGLWGRSRVTFCLYDIDSLSSTGHTKGQDSAHDSVKRGRHAAQCGGRCSDMSEHMRTPEQRYCHLPKLWKAFPVTVPPFLLLRLALASFGILAELEHSLWCRSSRKLWPASFGKVRHPHGLPDISHRRVGRGVTRLAAGVMHGECVVRSLE